MGKKVKEWIKRYSVAELISFSVLLISTNVAMLLFDNIIIAAFIGTWSENIGFYGAISFKDLRAKKKKLVFHDYVQQVRNMFIEFGPAEYFDSFLVRPFLLSFFPYILSNYSLAIVIATVCANVVYYLAAVMGYELRKKMFKA